MSPTSNPPILFTTLKVSNGKPIALTEHLHKLLEDAKNLKQIAPSSLLENVLQKLKDPQFQNGHYKMKIILQDPLQIEITPLKLDLKPSYHLGIYHKPFVEDLAQYKKSNFDNRLQKLQEAFDVGFDDWIFYNDEGYFLESSICNLFWIKDQTLYTPHPKLPLYFGVTIQNVMIAAKQLGYQIETVYEKNIEVLNQSFVYVCNSLKEIKPVSHLQNQALKMDLKLTAQLQCQYQELVAQECEIEPNLLKH